MGAAGAEDDMTVGATGAEATDTAGTDAGEEAAGELHEALLDVASVTEDDVAAAACNAGGAASK